MAYQQYTNQNRYRQSYYNDMRGMMQSSRHNSMPIAMAYVPIQQWGEIYDLDKAFSRGTIFAELDKPFLERSCCKR